MSELESPHPELSSPYAPPTAELRGRPSGGVPPSVDSGDPSKVDPAISLQFPFQHPGWWKPAVALGLVYLVPIYGVVLMLGWIQGIYDGVRAGTLERLPDVAWGGDFQRGLRLTGVFIVGTLVWTVGLMGIIAAFGALGASAELLGAEGAGGAAIAVGSLLVQIPMLGFIFGSYAVGGELGRRALNGDLLSLLRWKRSVQVIVAHPVPYLITLAGLFAAMMAMYAGMFACYFGLFVSMPIGAAMAAHVLAQWDRYLEHHHDPHRH